MLAIVAPGQGAQAPGMLAPWLELPGVTDRLRWATAVTGIDLIAAGTTAGAEAIRDTAVAQPLLVATGLAVAAELDEATAGDPRAGAPRPGLGPAGARPVGVVAGHSVGELTAAALAGAFSLEAALAFVGARGRAMAAASARTPTGMIALLGGDPDEVLAALDRQGLVAANVNGAGQIVAAGPLDALDRLVAAPPERTRVRRLSVAGAFHSEAMRPAVGELGALASGVPVHDPLVRFVANADGAVVSSGAELVRRLVEQVAAPVRWDACQATFAELGVDALVELPPAGTLSGLARRVLPDVETLAVKTPDDLAAARRLLATAGGSGEHEAPAWRLVVAPLGGTLHRDPVTAPGRPLAAGAVLGTVESRRASVPVAAATDGILVEWLAGDGDPVGVGQPIARLHPAASYPVGR